MENFIAFLLYNAAFAVDGSLFFHFVQKAVKNGNAVYFGVGCAFVLPAVKMLYYYMKQ